MPNSTDFIEVAQLERSDNDWHIPFANKPHTITLDDYVFEDQLKEGKKIYRINLNTRTIDGPSTFGVKMEHNAEMFIFCVDRYYDTRDLAQTCCIIQFKTIDKYDNVFIGLYPVEFFDITSRKDQDEILIPWTIPRSVTQTATSIEYNFRFYEVDEQSKKVIYNLNTQPATGKVLNTLDIDDSQLNSTYKAVVDAYVRDTGDANYELFIQRIKKCYDDAELKWENAADLLTGL